MLDLWDSLFRTIAALAVVLGLMGLLTVVARRLLGGRLGAPGTRPLVQVLASGYIAPRKTIALVSVAGDYLIVGTTANDVVPLGRVSDAGRVDALLAASGSTGSPGGASGSGPFGAWLQALTSTGASAQQGRHGHE